MNGKSTLLSAIIAAAVCLSGCNLTAIAIKGTVDGTREFSKSDKGKSFADPEDVGPVVQAATVTNEGLLYYVPDYEPLLLGAIFSNVAWGVAWLGASADQAELEGNFD